MTNNHHAIEIEGLLSSVNYFALGGDYFSRMDGFADISWASD
jgi:hypothetical protein